MWGIASRAKKGDWLYTTEELERTEIAEFRNGPRFTNNEDNCEIRGISLNRVVNLSDRIITVGLISSL